MKGQGLPHEAFYTFPSLTLFVFSDVTTTILVLFKPHPQEPMLSKILPYLPASLYSFLMGSLPLSLF